MVRAPRGWIQHLAFHPFLSLPLPFASTTPRTLCSPTDNLHNPLTVFSSTNFVEHSCAYLKLSFQHSHDDDRSTKNPLILPQRYEPSFRFPLSSQPPHHFLIYYPSSPPHYPPPPNHPPHPQTTLTSPFPQTDLKTTTTDL